MTSPEFKIEYGEAVQQFRLQKDAFFRSAPQSPIPASQREDFSGLRYFAPDVDLRVIAKVELLPVADPVEMATTDGAARAFERYAQLHFTIGDTACTLVGYRAVEDSGQDLDGEVTLFVPFRDALSTRETYGAGRYLDVSIEQAEDGSGPFVILDFNLAYNPYCAYNELYSCPITPFENSLPVGIRAGERM